MITVQNATLAAVHAALADIGNNRLSSHAVKFARLQLAVSAAVDDFNAMKAERIKAYDESGAGWADPADAPPDLLEEVSAILAATVELNAQPIPAELLDSVEAKPNSIAVLLSIPGIIEDEDGEDAD